jgi:polysaccharide biosynthesis transport protein
MGPLLRGSDMNDKSLITTMQDSSMKLPVTALPQIHRPEVFVETQSGSVLDYCRMIGRRKLLLAGFTLAGLAVAVGITLPQTPVYRARTSLEIQQINNDVLNIKSSDGVTPPTDALTDIQTQIKILQSQTLIRRALEALKIPTAESATSTQAVTPAWRRLFNLPAPGEKRETPVESAAKNLKVNAAGQTRIVEIIFDANRPEFASRFANALTSEFIEQNIQARWDMNHQTADWLAGQIEELRGKLRGSENALQAYARQKNLIYTGDKQNISEEKLRQLQAELSRAQADRVEKESRFEIARSAASDTLPDVLNDNNLRALEVSLTDLRRQQAQLGVTFTPDYAKTKRLQAEITALESAIQEKRAAIVTRINNELHESKRREQLLAAAYANQTRLVTDDSEKSIQYDMLKHEVDTNRQLYETMLQRVKESSIVSAMKASNVRIIDPAMTPRYPYKPNLAMNGVAGLLFGGILGLIVIVFRERTNSSVQEPGDAGLLLGIPELGVIPNTNEGQKLLSSTLTLLPKTTELARQGAQTISSQSPMVADSFRAVLASIIFASPRERQRVLVITSASPSEGKTTTASNLAMTLANMNRRVLIIDGDIRSPRLHDIFGLNNSAGLTDLLTQPSTTLMADTLVRETTNPNLSVLTSGPAIQTGADLLFSRSMPALIAHYRENFDMVLIDTPPMLSMPDARVLGRMADAVVLIARAGRTTRAAIQAAFRRLVDDHTQVLGIVLNGWNAKASAAYKYYAAYKEPGANRSVETSIPKAS